MAEVRTIGNIRNALRLHMERKGLKAKELSRQAGLNETAVRDLMDRTSDPRIGTLVKLATVLGCTPETLFGGLLPISGCIVPGGEIRDASECGAENTWVAPVAGIIGEPMVYQVAGDHLRPVYGDGDVIFAVRDDSKPVAEFVGEECVMQLAGTGALVFKALGRGHKPGRFTLRSFNAADVEDVALSWVAPAVAVVRNRLNSTRLNGG
jgi:repressor LexA